MYNQYPDIKETLKDINCPESYIEKGLNELGYESFPKSGLSDKGTKKLLNTVLDIYKDESNLSLSGYKTKVIKQDGKIIIQKEKRKKPAKQPKSLELLILKEDLQKIGETIPKIVKKTTKVITYPTIGTTFLFPTMFRKVRDTEEGEFFFRGCTIFWSIVENAAAYTTLAVVNPKLILPVALTQIGANVLSGFYEWGRSIKKRAEKRKKPLTKS